MEPEGQKNIRLLLLYFIANRILFWAFTLPERHDMMNRQRRMGPNDQRTVIAVLPPPVIALRLRSVAPLSNLIFRERHDIGFLMA
jgi:hypothetical protein